jgi:hypothetical protein
VLTLFLALADAHARASADAGDKENTLNGKTDLCGRQLVRRHLVEQRLEGVVVVFVDERDPDVGITQFFSAPIPPKPAPRMITWGMSAIASPLYPKSCGVGELFRLSGVREMPSCALAVVSSPAVITAFLANRRITASRAIPSSNHPLRRIATGDYGPRNQR